MPSKKKIQIKSVANTIISTITKIKPLLTDDLLNDAVLKRAFVRYLATLGEALKAFQENHNSNNESLRAIQSLKAKSGFGVEKNSDTSEDSLILVFKWHRNRLLHDYLIEHLLGDEIKLIAAFQFCNENLVLLEASINLLLTIPEVNNGAECISITKKAPSDMSEYTILDYAVLAEAEIEEFKLFLKKFELLGASGNFQKDNFIQTKQDNKHIIPAILNYIENSCSLLKLYNSRYADNPEFEKDETLSGNTLKVINKGAFDFLINVHDKRRKIAHDFKVKPSPSDLNYYTNMLSIINESYLAPSIELLKKRGIANNITINQDSLLIQTQSSTSNASQSAERDNKTQTASSLSTSTRSSSQIMNLLNKNLEDTSGSSAIPSKEEHSLEPNVNTLEYKHKRKRTSSSSDSSNTTSSEEKKESTQEKSKKASTASMETYQAKK